MVDFAASVFDREGEASPIDDVDDDQRQSLEKISGKAGASFSDRLREREKLREQGILTPSLEEIDKEERNKRIQSQLVAQGFPEAGIGEPGLEDTTLRFDLGLSDTFAEKKAKFLSKYPDGDFVLVGDLDATGGLDGKMVMFRRNEKEAFSEVDAGALEKFELLGDLADVSGDLPAFALEIAFTRGATFSRQLLQIAAGNVAGDTAKEIIEAARGFQKETFGQQAERIGARTGIAALGGAGTVFLSGPLNAFRGAPLITLHDRAAAAQAAARRVGAPELMPSQLSRWPIIRLLGKQSAASVPSIGDYVRDQNRATMAALTSLRDKDALNFALGNIKDLHSKAMDQILRFASASKVSLTKSGTAIREGIAEYSNLSRGLVNRAYVTARQIGTPEFDLEPALAASREVRAGVVGRGRDGGDVSLNPVTDAVKKELDRLDALDPSLPSTFTPDGTEVTSTDQLRAVQSNLWHLTQIGPDGLATASQRQERAQASKMLAALNKVLDNPKNADPNFKTAWLDASAEARKRFETLEKFIVIQAGKTETPAQLASRLAKPLEVDNLETLRSTLTAEKWGIFQQGAKAEMIAPNNINRLSQRLAEFDRPTLDLLFDRGTQKQLRDIGDMVDRLNAAGIRERVQRQANVTGAVADLTRRNDTDAIRVFATRVKALDPADDTRRMVRGGIIEDVLERVRVRDKGEDFIGSGTLANEVSRLKSGPLWDILSKGDKAVLQDVDLLEDFLFETVDTGTSLAAANLAEQLRGLSAKGLATLLQVMGTGRLYTSPRFQRIVLGKGGERLAFARLRPIGAVLATAVTEEEASE